MEQFKKTDLFKLEQGDRFYFVSDKNKKVHEIISYGDRYLNIRADGQIRSKPIKTDKPVIFLRNVNEDN